MSVLQVLWDWIAGNSENPHESSTDKESGTEITVTVEEVRITPEGEEDD